MRKSWLRSRRSRRVARGNHDAEARPREDGAAQPVEAAEVEGGAGAGADGGGEGAMPEVTDGEGAEEGEEWSRGGFLRLLQAGFEQVGGLKEGGGCEATEETGDEMEG